MLATRIAPRMHAVACRILRDAALAEDAVQQALLRSWQDLAQLRDPARFSGWSYRILVRTCSPNEACSTEVAGGAARPHRARRARRRLLGRHRSRCPRARIPSAARRTAHRGRLHHYLGLPIREVAETVGAPVETVRSRLRRALRTLRAALEADDRVATDSHSRRRCRHERAGRDARARAVAVGAGPHARRPHPLPDDRSTPLCAPAPALVAIQVVPFRVRRDA